MRRKPAEYLGFNRALKQKGRGGGFRLCQGYDGQENLTNHLERVFGR